MLEVYGCPSSNSASVQDLQGNYVLIDGSKRAEAEKWLYELTDAPDYRNLFDGTEWASIRQVAPLIVGINPNHPQRVTLAVELKKFECGYGISSDQSLDAVANHMRQFIEVRHPLGHGVMLRFSDPAVARVLLAASGDGGMPEYWSTLESVHLPDALWNGWHVQVRPDAMPSQSGEKGDAKPYQLNELTLSRLTETDRRATLVTLLQHIEQYFPDRLATAPRKDVISILHTMMNQAINNGYTSRQALTHWCTVLGYLGNPVRWQELAPGIQQMFDDRPSGSDGAAARKAALAAMELAQTQNPGRAKVWE